MTQRPLRLILAAALSAALSGAARAEWKDPRFDGGKSGGTAIAADAVESPAAASPSLADGRLWIVVKAADKNARSRIADLGLSIEEVREGSVAGVATTRAIRRLEAAGFSVAQRLTLEEGQGKAFPPDDKDFHDYPAVLNTLDTIAAANKDVASLVAVGRSLQGRQILGIRFNTTAAGSAPSDKPGVLFLGTHHAREHLSTEVPLLLAQYLADHRSEPAVQKLLESRDVYIVPLVNPDGSEYDISDGNYKWQRKNMRPNPDGTTGVDLNRNYGYHWGEGGASTDPGDDTYRGPGAFSEPETQAVKAFIEARPNLRILLSYHTYSELILYPWGYSNDPIQDPRALKAFQAMAQKMANWTGYTPEQSSDLYIASGDTCDWAWGTHRIFAFTFELTPRSGFEGGFYPGAKAIQPTFQKNIQPALYLIGLADDPYRAAGASAVSAPPARPAARLIPMRPALPAR